MKNISKKIIQWLVEYGVIQKEDAELYEYAVFTVYILIFTLGVSIIIGGIMDMLWKVLYLLLRL